LEKGNDRQKIFTRGLIEKYYKKDQEEDDEEEDDDDPLGLHKSFFFIRGISVIQSRGMRVWKVKVMVRLTLTIYN